MTNATRIRRADSFARIHEALNGSPLTRDLAEIERELAEATKDYNGWTNYPTWCVHLWLTNDQGTDAYWREAAAYCRARADEEHAASLAGHLDFPRNARGLLADRLKEEIREQVEPDDVPDAYTLGLASDLLGYALDGVDWHEIADALMEE